MGKAELSKPNMAAKWFRDDKQIFEDTRHKLSIEGKTQKLIISDLQMEDSGLYTLKAGDLESACQIQVNASPVAVVAPLRPISDAPLVEGRLATLAVALNKAAEEAETLWFKNGVEIDVQRDKEKFEVIDEGRIQKLLVKDLDLEDGGEYKMTKGEMVSKAIIDIKEGPIEICKPPRLTAGSQTLEGNDVTFEASVTTKRAQGMWLKDGTQIHEGDKYKFGKTGKAHALTVCNLASTDSGRYTFCIDEGERNPHVKASTNLMVKSKPGAINLDPATFKAAVDVADKQKREAFAAVAREAEKEKKAKEDERIQQQVAAAAAAGPPPTRPARKKSISKESLHEESASTVDAPVPPPRARRSMSRESLTGDGATLPRVRTESQSSIASVDENGVPIRPPRRKSLSRSRESSVCSLEVEVAQDNGLLSVPVRPPRRKSLASSRESLVSISEEAAPVRPPRRKSI